MWQWFRNFFSPQIVVVKKLPQTEVDSGPYRTQGLYGVEPNWYPPTPPEPEPENANLLGIIQGAVEEVAEEQVKIQHKYLTNEKMRGYFQSSMKRIMSKLDSDGYNFVLLHRSDVGIPDEAFQLFMQIFVEACRKIGISATAESTYVNIDKASVKKLLKKIPTKTPRVDIDEKVRAMLG